MTTEQDAVAKERFCPTTTLTRRKGSAGADLWWELIEYLWEVLSRLQAVCVVDGMISGFTESEICEALVTEACPDGKAQLDILLCDGILLWQAPGLPPILDVYPNGALARMPFLWTASAPDDVEGMKNQLAKWVMGRRDRGEGERAVYNANRLRFAWRVSEGLNPSTGVVRRPPLGRLPELKEIELMLARLRFALEQPRSPAYRVELENAYAEWELARQEREALKMRAAFRQKPPQTRARKARAA